MGVGEICNATVEVVEEVGVVRREVSLLGVDRPSWREEDDDDEMDEVGVMVAGVVVWLLLLLSNDVELGDSLEEPKN